VLHAGRGELTDAPGALEKLCRAYWPPLYSFLRRQGHSPHDAEDLVQGFLARVLAREDLAEVGPEKGRFRTFLLTALRNFAIKQALRDKALKRGGGQIPISINAVEAERLCGPDLTTVSPEAAFERRFAQAVLARAFATLRQEYRARGKAEWFAALAPHLDGAEPDGYEPPAAQLGMTPGAVAVAVHRMRGRLRELLRAESGSFAAPRRKRSRSCNTCWKCGRVSGTGVPPVRFTKRPMLLKQRHTGETPVPLHWQFARNSAAPLRLNV
jgi:RNA polymerase sigma-70 factor (ECF subfamily)